MEFSWRLFESMAICFLARLRKLWCMRVSVTNSGQQETSVIRVDAVSRL